VNVSIAREDIDAVFDLRAGYVSESEQKNEANESVADSKHGDRYP
jgi:hypothetical protein